ncbi:3-oxoacyl-[acyl-carrier protein] reductase [Sphingobium sp. OAS761]|uniref:SDR family NAD(P)-dependent oxidoreductase n=1 Tax=Sphingobium sp. OAS761 TaxID=2817901 RepID=UPI0020A0759A|nr:SDR family oxidoreductase [Sphingobium sp. OAS761]MCP1470354.1 3-oxoacyl-[acyl-carrier protein] reductase [Sphingobium sp. OAS761]
MSKRDDYFLDLTDRTILVTGGGAGIGRGICLACGDAGANVAILAPSENGARTQDAVKARGGSALWVQGDVTVAADVERAVARAVEIFGGLDGIVHNAIDRRSGSEIEIQNATDDQWESAIGVSLRGAFNLARAAFPHLRPGRGRLLLMTSPAAMEGAVRRHAYAAVKGALRGFAKSLAVEWGRYGISVTCLSPLSMTPGLESAIAANPALKARLDRVVPLARVGDPETDIAPVVAFLMSSGSGYINGQTIIVDGGRFTTL